MAVLGEMPAARHAGMKAAASEAIPSSPAAVASVATANGRTWNMAIGT